LHGGSGISLLNFRKAISLGIAKINFFTGMSEAAIRQPQATSAILANNITITDDDELRQRVCCKSCG